jgi:hypothetical protein
MVVYGRATALARVDQRRQDFAGTLEHREAVREQRHVLRKERQNDPADTPEDEG